MKKEFDLPAYHWKPDIDYRKNPEQYKVGKGEQGVLLCNPYKAEILPFWKFRTPDIAQKSSQEIYALFLDYLEKDDFIGADMARKFIQMGFTRSRRYANRKGGRKYDPVTEEILPAGTGDPQKVESANIFKKVWDEAEKNPKYAQLKKEWKAKYG